MSRSLTVLLLAALASLPSLAAAATVYVNDSLTAPTSAGRGGSRGGSFGPAGWTTTGDDDAIWYEVPDALPTGRVEYSVSNLSLATNLTGADHDIFAMYQSPGIPEPVPYMPYFRNNDLKVFQRIFGAKETGRPGAFKFEFAFCPIGPPWYNNTCPASCDQGNFAYGGPSFSDIGWDASKTYKMAIVWGSGQISFSRDGVLQGTISYTGEYAAKPLRIRLGSPRLGINPETVMPRGAVFKDFRVEGTPGAQTIGCGAPQPGPDAGTPGNDAGVSVGAGVVAAIQDATAASWTSGAFPDLNELEVEASGAGVATEITYLRFPKIGGIVTRATLRLHTSSGGSAGGGSGEIHRVADDRWTESGLTWANRPAFDAAAYGPARHVNPDSDVDFDVTALVAAGTTNFALVSADSDAAHYLSREGGGARGPRLLVDVTAGLDAGVSAPDAAIPADATTIDAADAGALPESPDVGVATLDPDPQDPPARKTPKASPSAAPEEAPMTGGCQCSTGAAESATSLLFALSLLAGGVRRRVRR